MLALPKILGSTLVAGAGWCFLLGELWFSAGWMLLAAAVFVIFRDREKVWGIRCERCRSEMRGAIERQKPKLDGRTEINLF